ncbi:MAG: XTP/dITP diphosphatase [Candidatus Freyarchaeota archaeon]|nr:XTP/dITP diphosphatase [Candidatus Jordarchaeia archaeon]
MGKVKRVLFATGNKHKFHEAEIVLSKYGLSVEQWAVKRLEVQSESLEEIAKTSLAWLMLEKYPEYPFFVEDAGLFVNALNGFPGPYSSYVFNKIGNEGLLKLMDGVENRRAEFISVVAFTEGKEILVFEGRTSGFISYMARGERGFGFDPVFIPEEGDGRSFAELDVEEKNRMSHRAKALRKLAEWLTSSKII